MPTYLDMPQLSAEWHARRRGCITASNSDRLFGTPLARTKYLYELAAQRICAEETEPFRGNYWTERGQLLEAEARSAIEFELDTDIAQVGLCVSDVSPWFVVSPDGLIGDDAILQIKCPAPQTHVAYAVEPDKLASEYMHQLTAESVASGRENVVIASYCPGMRLVLRAIKISAERRAKFLDSIAQALAEVEAIIHQVKL